MRGCIETLGMSQLHIDQSTRNRYISIVTEETQRLERVIGDLLVLARLDVFEIVLPVNAAQIAARN